MKEYKRSDEGFTLLKRKFLLLFIPIIVAGTGIPLYQSNTKEPNWFVSLLPVIILIIVWAIMLFRMIAKSKSLYYSITFAADDKSITTYEQAKPPKTIYYDTITNIAKNGKGTIIITSALNKIIIPADVVGIQEIESGLQNIIYFDSRSNRPTIWSKYSAAIIALLLLFFFVIVFTQTHPVVVGISGTIVVCTLVYCFFKGYNKKDIPYEIRKKLWFVWLPIFATIVHMVIKITGMLPE